MKNKFFWLSIFLMCFALFMPSQSKGGGFQYDKEAHFLLFAFVSLNTVFYFAENSKKLMTVLVFVCLLPILTELIQTLIPGRNYDFYDIIADYIGIIFGIVLFIILKKPFVAIYQFFGDKYVPNSGNIPFL